jgi:hypothetical protein
LIKYLKRYACNRILTITAPTEQMKGITPTENTSSGETGVKLNRIRKGTMLAAIATILHFKSCHWIHEY